MPLFGSLCLNRGLLYMHFSAIPHFRRYISACLTCVSAPSSISAGTYPLALPALFHHPQFPQVHIRLPYMHFSAILNFRRYNSSCRTCAFPPSSISAGTYPLALHALFRHSAFPQAQFLLLYMHFSAIPHFRRYKIPAHSKSVDGYNHQYHFKHFQIHKSPRSLSLCRLSAAFSGISVCVRRRHGSHRCG